MSSGLRVLALLLFLICGSAAYAMPITLPLNEITRLSYAGEERFNDTNGNHAIDAGDYCEGIASFQSIVGMSSGTDLSSQLASKEITVHFKFSVTAGSGASGHLEFALLPGDFFSAYVGQGATKNYDPNAADAIARASDGTLWLDVRPGTAFESVNDRQPNGSTLNRAWMEITANGTGYTLASALFPTFLGEDPTHLYDGTVRGDIPSQLYFENNVAGYSTAPGFTFHIFGPVYVKAVPAPATWSLLFLGVAGLALTRRPSRRPALA